MTRIEATKRKIMRRETTKRATDATTEAITEYAIPSVYDKARTWLSPDEMAETLDLDGTLAGEPVLNTRRRALMALRRGDTSLFATPFDRRTVPLARRKMLFGLAPDIVEPDASKAVVDDSGTQSLRKSETEFLRDMWHTGEDEDRKEIKRLLKTYLFRKDLDDLVKKADADRNRMVRANRVAAGLESKEPAPMRDSAGRALKPGMKVIGKGGNRMFVTPDELKRLHDDRARFAKEHPLKYYGAYPMAAGGAALSGAAAASPAATFAAVRPMARAASKAFDVVDNPLALARMPRWVGPAAGVTGALGPHAIRMLPDDKYAKVPGPVKKNLKYLRWASPLRGLGLGLASDIGLGYALDHPEKAVDTTVTLANRYAGHNDTQISGNPVNDVLLGIGKDKAKDKIKGKLSGIVDVARERLGKVQGGVKDISRNLYSQLPGDMAKVVDLLNEGKIAWDSLPEDTRGAIVSYAGPYLSQKAIDGLVALKYPKFDLDSTVEDVNDFYNRVVVPTKERYAGTPGKDYDDRNYRKDFVKDLDVHQDVKAFAPVYGWSSPMDIRNGVHLNRPPLYRTMARWPDIIDSVITHEATHEQNNDTPSLGIGRPHSGVSRREQDIADRAYGFDADAMAPFYPKLSSRRRELFGKMEEITTNREFRRAIDREITRQLGHPPSVDEFVSWVDKASPEELRRLRADNVFSGYAEAWRRKYPRLSPKQIEAWRRALKEVAYNQPQHGTLPRRTV